MDITSGEPLAVIAADPEAAVRGAGIVITATTSSTPVFPGSAVAPGVRINAVGLFRPTEICAGKRAGRETAGEITVFKSVGHAVMDAAVARVAYERALQRGLGSTVDLGIWPTQIPVGR